eukprot:3020629-Pleurochrysis_carterae.AAC.6
MSHERRSAPISTRLLMFVSKCAETSPEASKIRPGVVTTTSCGVCEHAALNAWNFCSTKPG